MDVEVTRVVNLYKERYDVYIGRGGQGKDGYFGNPFPLGGSTREEVLEKYRAYFNKRVLEDAEFKQRVLELKGKVLGCFCKPKACHGDVIVEFVEGDQWVSSLS